MKITDLLTAEGVRLGVDASTREEALDALIDLQVASGKIADRDAYREAVLAREAETSTAVGDGVAIPHAKTPAVKAPGLVAITVPGGVDWNAPDGEPSDLMFLIAARDDQANEHLEVLSKLATLLVHEEVPAGLRAAKTPEEFLAVIDRAEAAYDEERAADEAARAASSDLPRILAITACPTGIAHTYMAAENLEKAAEAMGVTIKVETQGSVGAKNVLTAEEIAACEGVIVAADKAVDYARFGGKRVLTTSVSSGINEPEQLLETVLHGDVPVYEGKGGAVAAPAAGENRIGIGGTIYRHLMNGISHMIPFVVGGGILMALSFLFDQAGVGTSSYGSSTPLAAFFNVVGSQSFNFMLPILSAYISMSIADRPGLAPGMVGGWIAKQGFTFAYLSTAMDAEAQAALVSGGFLAAMFAGFAAGYLTLAMERLFDRLPDALEGMKPVLIYPLISVFLIGLIMLAFNPLFAWINTLLSGALNSMGTGNLALVCAIIGGMMSVDLGGPVNKVASAFALAMLAENTFTGQQIMAACMIGGMVPPIVVALSTTFFKNRWTAEDRKAGVVNYVLGCSFISEGAIPYAAADPLRVLPSCIVGSAVSAVLSCVFGCASPAPHGGVWVIAVISNPLGYLLALVVGSLVGALILSFLKKPLAPEVSGLSE